jgi:hypothetical protein
MGHAEQLQEHKVTVFPPCGSLYARRRRLAEPPKEKSSRRLASVCTAGAAGQRDPGRQGAGGVAHDGVGAGAGVHAHHAAHVRLLEGGGERLHRRRAAAGELPGRRLYLCWVTLRAPWVTLRAPWATLRARWATLRAPLGYAYYLCEDSEAGPLPSAGGALAPYCISRRRLKVPGGLFCRCRHWSPRLCPRAVPRCFFAARSRSPR